MTGKVWLVGAGPGDAGLMTMKGYEVLKSAQVVVYDSLIAPSILAMIPREAKKIDVGKRAGNHKVVQEGINKILLDEALSGKDVVRLKGGDPFLFGRGGEEIALLQENGVSYEVIPGVTSAISVPAYNGIPVTHRDFCSSVHIITGHKRAGESYDIDFEALVNTKGTLVFLMGISALKDICDNLIEAGMSSDMPAAVLQEGTTARQRRVVATVGTLYERAMEEKIGTPGIIVVGKVCQLSEDFDWYSKLPLFGRRILITRPKETANEMVDKLRKLGAEVVELPAIQIISMKNNPKLDKAFDNIKDFGWIVLTSPVGVRELFSYMCERKIDIRKLSHLKIGAIGSGTEKELNRYGLYADVIPESFDGASLGKAIAKVAVKNERILIPRSAQGNKEIIEELKDFEVHDIASYDIMPYKQDVIDIERELNEGRFDCITFTSSSSVKAFMESYPNVAASGIEAICIGEKTMSAALQYGFNCVAAKRASVDSMVETIVNLK